MRFFIAAATHPDRWRRRLRPLKAPALIGCVGQGAADASKHLSALFSAEGMPNRWLSLRKRPSLLEGSLRCETWIETPLYHLMQPVSLLILDAEESQLYALRSYLFTKGVIDKTHFFPAHPIPQTLYATQMDELKTWAEAMEELRSDMELATQWLPCILTPFIA
ncbi:MAG: hypothetical protein N3E49_02610 [Bacteroidia bacterium]|nr:hypothetical protein [Bacteroidia bacterium]